MRSLTYRLLAFFLPVCLIPLIFISAFSYFQARERITEDRIVLYLEQIAQDMANTVRLTLLEKEEETISMTLYEEFRNYLLKRRRQPPQQLLDSLVMVHEVYDLIVIFDAEGNIVLVNSIDRNRKQTKLNAQEIRQLLGQKVDRFTPEGEWLRAVRSGRLGYLHWHRSKLVERLYDYRYEDVARQYNIGFAAPILDERGMVVGGLLALMNWEFIQEILDGVEVNMEGHSLPSGYAFLFDTDKDTVIGHKFRRNRNYQGGEPVEASPVLDNYGTSLIHTHKLVGLQKAVVEGAEHFRYEYPAGTAKISGLKAVDHPVFSWVVGVGINDEDIFAPVQRLKWILIWTACLSAGLVILVTYGVARRITFPLKKLTLGAKVIAGGDLSQRVEVQGRDEIGELARTFNEMASSLQERSQALTELNRSLEEKVRERTRELEEAGRQARQAYEELKQTQVQLIQSEKMASLGQLVAGIAHEIKNPLNFIYGNTEFLKKYLQELKELVAFLEEQCGQDPARARLIAARKEEIHYDFLLRDLETLVQNFEEGAERIHSIISDLKTFSRVEKDTFRPADLHEAIELALNLLQHEFRERITLHKEYGELPRIECNPGRLSQVFMNLLANACQAIEGEGEIWIRTRRRDGTAVVEIQDTGHGIEGGLQEKIFEPFFTTKGVGQGTGLGLSISYGIVQQHGGTITVESEKGKGSLFRVELPLKRHEQ